MKLYFEGIICTEEAKKRFKELAKENHPDIGGSVEIMKEINRQYDDVMKGIFQKAGKSITEIDDLLKDLHEMRDKIWQISQLPDILIELCGDWIWITGNTKPVKDILKSISFAWSQKKSAWYWRKNTDKRRRFGTMDLEKIREKYGSSVIKNSRNYKLVA